jgi:hypothetical protein
MRRGYILSTLLSTTILGTADGTRNIIACRPGIWGIPSPLSADGLPEEVIYMEGEILSPSDAE